MHYPGYLRDAFHEALWAHHFQDETEIDPDLFSDDSTRLRWITMGTEERLMSVAGKLWHCTDIMPGETCEVLDMQPGSTYARAARRVRQGLVVPLKPL